MAGRDEFFQGVELVFGEQVGQARGEFEVHAHAFGRLGEVHVGLYSHEFPAQSDVRLRFPEHGLLTWCQLVDMLVYS